MTLRFTHHLHLETVKKDKDMMTFIEKLEEKWDQGRYTCIGLDPVDEKLPEEFRNYAPLAGDKPAYLTMQYLPAMVRVVHATKHVAACYKPNWAFFLSQGYNGLLQLEMLMETIRTETDVPTVLDFKEGDIGDTMKKYGEAAFDVLGADAVTVPPYLGHMATKPILERRSKGVFVLCRTSNPGAGEFQDLIVTLTDEQLDIIYQGLLVGDGIKTTTIPRAMPLYQYVAWQVANPHVWNFNDNCGLVVGSTYPEELAEIRKIAPRITLLLPGFGKQGGDVERSIAAAGDRFLANFSSAICLAEDPGAAALAFHKQVHEARTLRSLR